MSTIRSISPQSPDDVVLDIPAVDPAAVGRLASAARAAQGEWAAATPGLRSAALDAAATAVAAAGTELADLVVREVGKPRAEAAGEVARAVSILRYYAQQVYDPIGAVHAPSSGSGLAYTYRRPRGVAGLVTPWNFPLAIPLWKAGPALAYGNAVLLKPAPQSTACALRLGELLKPHLPDGLLAVLPGGSETGSAVVEHADVVSFTGSWAVGRSVTAAAVERGVSVQAEMGGQNPAIVLPDADPATVAAQVASAAFGFAGQKCTATKRVVIVGDAGPFVDALVAATIALPLGDPDHLATVVGPVIERRARDRVLAAAGGGRILTGGSSAARDGWFVEPTLVRDLPAGHELLCEEVFGPICAITTADSVAEAVSIANDVRYGLTAAVYTADLDAALHVTGLLTAGQIKVNAPTTGVDFYLPFGGERDSSSGPREQGKAAQDFYTSIHTVTVAAARR